MAGEGAAEGAEIDVLTGAGPAWLYLALAHEIHDRLKIRLIYNHPATGDVAIFDHREPSQNEELLKDLVIWSIETGHEDFVEELRRDATARGMEQEINDLIEQARKEWLGRAK